jgi:hypothetical protein
LWRNGGAASTDINDDHHTLNGAICAPSDCRPTGALVRSKSVDLIDRPMLSARNFGMRKYRADPASPVGTYRLPSFPLL